MATDLSHEAAAITLEKIAFELSASDWHGHATESVWAERTGTDLYRIRNVPFFARGASHRDVVRTRPGEPFPIVASVVQRSGHSTYRVIADADVFNRRWPTFGRLGCTFERADARLVAIDVPPSADIHAVYDALEAGERDGDWDFEEGHCGHPS